MAQFRIAIPRYPDSLTKKTIMRTTTILRTGTLLLIFFAGCRKTAPDTEPFTPPFDINAVLQPPADNGSGATGYIKFRQDPDTARIISLETWVNALKPRHTYLLQRAVNPITDPDCSSTAWLTLGKGLVPQAIHTDAGGNGHEDLWRDVTTIARGTQFRIHFQIIDSATQTPVLTSDCEMYEVR